MNSPYASVLLIAVLVLLMYFVVLRPQRKRQQAQAQTMRTLEAGTRVMMTSGIYATIVSVGEKQIVLETSPGVELTVLKQAVAKVVPAGEEDDQAAFAAGPDGSHDELDGSAPDDYRDEHSEDHLDHADARADDYSGQGYGYTDEPNPHLQSSGYGEQNQQGEDSVRTSGTEASEGPEQGAVARSAYDDSAFQDATAQTWPPAPADRTDAPGESSRHDESDLPQAEHDRTEHDRTEHDRTDGPGSTSATGNASTSKE